MDLSGSFPLVRTFTPFGARRLFVQNFTGGVAVDTFPRNNKVIVMDNKLATDTFDIQPSQEVVQHGAGVVIVQTTRVRQRRIIGCCCTWIFLTYARANVCVCVCVYVSDLAKKPLVLLHAIKSIYTLRGSRSTPMLPLVYFL